MRVRPPSRVSPSGRGCASPTEALITAAVLAALAASVPAQRQFDELGKRGWPADSDYTWAVALGDVDGDGDVDLVFGNSHYRIFAPVGQQNRLYLNDGTGTYTDATAQLLPADIDLTTAVALGDVDGDGDLDLVFGNGFSFVYPPGGQQNRLYLNDGSGAYTDVTAARMPADGDETHAVALGDVDSDGDLDLVLGNYTSYGQQNRLYLNDGTGTFTDATAARMPAARDQTHAVALGDVDGDGDLDLVFGNSDSSFQSYGRQNRLYMNDGTGIFTAGRLPHVSDGTYAVALGDVDGDGDLDLVFGNAVFTVPFRWANLLYLNDGTGTYTVAGAQLPADSDVTMAVALGDVDGDGDLDLVFGNYTSYGQQNRLYLNDGTGTFTDATAARMPADSDGTRAVALDDVDGDGDLDLVFGNGPLYYGRQNRLYLNLLRQLDAAFLARVGFSYQLDVYTRFGPPSLVDVALPFLSTATASLAVPPFGTFGISPTQMLALPPFLIPQPAGVGSVSFAVPNVPGLVGTSFYAQALLVPYPFQARLTNVTADVIIQ